LSAAASNYIVISPVKDEEKHIETTIRAMVHQTIRPWRWVIVDDASRDRTLEIVERYSREHSWIQVLRIQRDARRQLGSAEIRAFHAGYGLIQGAHFDFIVKLDGDLDLAPDYFEQLIRKFHEDDKLGIASGIYRENHDGEWQAVRMPVYHASGASKMMRAKCFREIGGFESRPGWDTVDEIKAQTRGWKTCHFENLTFLHLKPEGSAFGAIQTNLLHGEVYYVTGGDKLFFLMKLLHRMLTGEPFLWGGLAMLWGYLHAWATDKPLLVSDAEARFYQRLLNRRITVALESVLKRIGLKREREKEAWSPS